MAERGGFEPPVRFYPYNGLANRRIRPLCHLSYKHLQLFSQTSLTFADTLPTFEDMKTKRPSNPDKVTVGNIIVRIYKRQRPTASGKRRTVFEVADYTSGARRFRGFSEAGEARREAEKIARQLSTGEATAATMRNTEAASFGRAIEILRPTGVSLELAAASFAEAFKILNGNAIVEAAKFYLVRHKPIQPKAVVDVVAELMAVKESRGASARYVQDLRSRLDRFAGDFKKDIGSVTLAEIQQWLDGLKLSTQTYVNFRRVLHLLFQFAVSRGYAFENPVADADRVKVRSGDTEIFTPDEIARLLSAADAEFLPVLAIGAFAGLRTAEIERLAWDDIDLAGRIIKIGASKAKTASRRIVPISDTLAAWLAPYAAERGDVWPDTTATLLNRQRQTASAAGLKWKHNALRHSYASYRFAEIGDAGRVAGELGNSAAVVHRHYRELVKQSDAVAWFAVKPEGPGNVVAMAREAAR
jgi:integrase